jgi:hypothetical protein
MVRFAKYRTTCVLNGLDGFLGIRPFFIGMVSA